MTKRATRSRQSTGMPIPHRPRRFRFLPLLLLAALACQEAHPEPPPSSLPAVAAELGDVIAPLPAPLEVPETRAENLPGQLAAEIRTGSAPVPAMMRALELSGIGVRGEQGSLVVRPALPAQGIVVEWWEVPFLAALARADQTVLIALPDLADLLRHALPVLQDAPVETLLLKDLRRHAGDTNSPLHFWATFIGELGKQRTENPGSDLLTAAAPDSVILDGLQASLMLRRLGTDILVLGHAPPTPRPALLRVPHWLLPTPLYAASAKLPCTVGETEAWIMDITAMGSSVSLGGVKVGDLGFSGLLGYLESKGVSGVETFKGLTAVAGALLSYAQGIATYLALEVPIEMADQPLPRTRDMYQHGAEREVVATVRMDIGSFQTLNCFRIMLNSMGLDFSLPNDGAVEGAGVAWRGIQGFNQAAAALPGGPEYFVHFASSTPRIQESGSAPRSDVTQQRTDKAGRATMRVQGAKQKRAVPRDAMEVTRIATLSLQVAVKGPDLFKDLMSATGAAIAGVGAAVTLPMELLLRSKWATGGTLSFPVTDWESELQLRITFEELRPGGSSGYGLCAVGQIWEGEFEPAGDGRYEGRFTMLDRSTICGEETNAGRFMWMCAANDKPGCAKRTRGEACYEAYSEQLEQHGFYMHRSDVTATPQPLPGATGRRGDGAVDQPAGDGTYRLTMTRIGRPPREATCDHLAYGLDANFATLTLPAMAIPLDGPPVFVKTPYGTVTVERIQ